MKIWSVLSVVFALAAAGFWGWSATINVPTIYSGFGTLGTVIQDGSKVAGTEPFYLAIAKISHLNAISAGCALASAFSQAVLLWPRKSR